MRKLVQAGATIAVAVQFIGVGSPTQAAPKEGTCPGPFQAFTLEQFVDLALSVGQTSATGERTFARVDKNNDGIICVQDLTTEKKPKKYNWIDNNAR